jgi:ABC-type transporter Mla subunit MlaD
MTTEQKIDHLNESIVNFAVVTERRAKTGENSFVHASQSLAQASKSVSSAAQDIKSITSQTLSSAMQSPTKELDDNIKAIANKLYAAAHEVNESVAQANKKFSRIILWTLATSVISGVVVFGAWFYMYKQLDAKIERAEWVSGINAAVATGKLTTCNEGGVCALVDNKRLVRLDK